MSTAQEDRWPVHPGRRPAPAHPEFCIIHEINETDGGQRYSIRGGRLEDKE